MKQCLFVLALALSLITSHAQAPGVTIEEQSPRGVKAEQSELSRQARELFEAGQLLSLEATTELIDSPLAVDLELPPAQQKPLSATEIAKRARQSHFKIGWAYLCNNCDNWHINLAGGYAITDDGVIATCAHVVKTDRKKMRDGSIIAVDAGGQVYPVTSILASDDKIDGALLKIEVETTPLPLNDQVAPGDAAFCLSRPLKQGGYFSQGIVNRFYWNQSPRDDDPGSLKSLGALKMNVSSRWAPGSSGSAVLDVCGNVIGHVSTISTMGKKGSRKDGDQSRTLITLHTATPARAMMALAAPKPVSN